MPPTLQKNAALAPFHFPSKERLTVLKLFSSTENYLRNTDSILGMQDFKFNITDEHRKYDPGMKYF